MHAQHGEQHDMCKTGGQANILPNCRYWQNCTNKTDLVGGALVRRVQQLQQRQQQRVQV